MLRLTLVLALVALAVASPKPKAKPSVLYDDLGYSGVPTAVSHQSVAIETAHVPSPVLIKSTPSGATYSESVVVDAVGTHVVNKPVYIATPVHNTIKTVPAVTTYSHTPVVSQVVAQPVLKQVVQEHVVSQPAVVQQHVVAQPAVVQPVVQQHVVSTPVVQQRVVSTPVVHQKYVSTPVVQQRLVEQVVPSTSYGYVKSYPSVHHVAASPVAYGSYGAYGGYGYHHPTSYSVSSPLVKNVVSYGHHGYHPTSYGYHHPTSYGYSPYGYKYVY